MVIQTPAAADGAGATMLSNAGLPRSSIGSYCGSMRNQPPGDINGTTQFREEAGAVSDPSGLIHLSAQQIGVFPVYPPHHILHPAILLYLSSISEAALISYLGI